jgi:translocation and assembly module TamB
LSRGRIQAATQDWQLQQPASLSRRADGRLELGAHCWASLAAATPDARLCAENQRLLPDPSLRFTLQRFALASLQPWLPDDFAWDGMLNGELVLDLPASGPKGHIRLDAGPGTLRLREQQQWLEFAYQRLQLESQLTPSKIASSLAFASTQLGQLNVNLNLDPRSQAKPLDGDFRLQGLNLAVARPFASMVDHLAGQLNGSGRLSGSLLAPRVDGQLQLANGEISGAELPVEFQDLGLNLLIAGTQAQLTGQWRGGEQGRGQLQGSLDWSQALALELQLSGQQLPVRVEPYARLEADPELRLQLSDQRLSISGRIDVPRGAIEIRELPPSTVKLSEDARIVGEEQDEVAGLNIGMDITVQIGQDKLTFSGFGLNAELAGQVHIGDNLDTRGTLSLNKGRYRAYGQRLNIRRARLFFAGPVDQPYLDVEAVRKVDDVIAGLRLSGSVQQPTTRIFSEPTMSQEQALSYLVLGRPLGGTGEESNVLGQAALALGLAGSSSITTGIATSLGIRDFELDTQGSGLTTSVVATGKISERLSLRYGLGVFEPANTFALRYELTRRLYLEAASGLASSLDIFYKRDF